VAPGVERVLAGWRSLGPAPGSALTWAQQAQLPLSHRQLLLAGTGVNAVLVLLAFLIKPGAAGWRFGTVSGILAALFATAALVIPAAQARKASA
jgi:hypothetical protein